MVKLKGPGLSLAATGLLADTVIFSTWKGRPTLKFSPTVKNPNTQPQQGRRAMLRFLAKNFASLSAADIATWSTLALKANTSAYNAWSKYNLDRWARFQYPTKAHPASTATDQGDPDIFTATALNRSIILNCTNGEWSGRWGYILYRSTSPAFTIATTNAIRIALWQELPGGDANYTDGPLSPDTYYYRLETFSNTGYQQWLFNTEVTATIT